MNWRKHMVLMVGGGIAIALLIAALVVLFRFQGQYGTTAQALESAKLRLQQLNARNPYPSDDNVKKTRANLSSLTAQALSMQDVLQKNKIEGARIEPAEFAQLLEKTSRRLQQKAQESEVLLPAGFAFGFPRYAEGALPSADAVFRLVGQLKTVETLCETVFQARIAQLDTLERETFEEGEVVADTGATANLRRRTVTDSAPVVSRIPLVEPNDLFSAERITLTFQGRETAVWDAINAIVRHPSFMVIADLRLENSLALAGSLGKKTPVTPITGEKIIVPQYPSHDDRIVAGREHVMATVVVDLYHFNAAFAAEAQP